MNALRSAWFIAVKDTQYMLRQTETVLWTFVMPIIFFYFIGTVTGGFTNSGASGVRDSLALESPLAGGFLVDELQRRLEEEEFEVFRNPEAPERFARRQPKN